ncbi:hypothetical protein [Microvirga makkahensis]|uniref:Transposase DDE domain-containing protein n=1 Tax=Microvirga makkahensis TaxID=1128670 RepID=A0A7X3MW06_9HYPH|nr:hypothetical protein [Microvirga makkahensis]MXQ14199.1 hypothetical protein [Microvirga makkahensis]
MLLDLGLDSRRWWQCATMAIPPDCRDICPAIPYRTTTKEKPDFFSGAFYRGRARIEQTTGKLKRLKRIALHCGKIDENSGSFVALALKFFLIKSVHTT